MKNVENFFGSVAETSDVEGNIDVSGVRMAALANIYYNLTTRRFIRKYFISHYPR
jgi:hypothetical protein